MFAYVLINKDEKRKILMRIAGDLYWKNISYKYMKEDYYSNYYTS